jgi:hypothetical protein
MRCRALVAAGLAASLAGCVPSNVVATTDRAVLVEADRAVWRPASAPDVAGLWCSGPLTGAVASSLLKVVYLFRADGQFAGAALYSGPPEAFEVLSGRWTVPAPGRIEFGSEAEPATLEVATGMLRLSGSDGTLVLYREELR